MEIIRTYYEDGKKREEYYRNKEGKPEGKYKHWHTNGQKGIESNYKNGSLEGKHESWNPKGQKHEESNYKNNLYEGKSEWWHSNGQKYIEKNYKNGILEGEYKYWDEKGILREYKYHLPHKEIILKNKIHQYTSLKKLITKKKKKKISQQMNKIRKHLGGLEQLIYNCIIGYLTEGEKMEIIRANKEEEEK